MHPIVDSCARIVLGHNLQADLLVTLVASVIVMLLILSLGKYLWNNSLEPLFTVVKPVKSIWQLFGFYILLCLLKT
jgi:hypothetical protein